MSRAATAKGTPRRRALELRALERLAASENPQFRQLPARMRKRMIEGYHRRLARGGT